MQPYQVGSVSPHPTNIKEIRTPRVAVGAVITLPLFLANFPYFEKVKVGL
jgi:hypothetical protein